MCQVAVRPECGEAVEDDIGIGLKTRLCEREDVLWRKGRKGQDEEDERREEEDIKSALSFRRARANSRSV